MPIERKEVVTLFGNKFLTTFIIFISLSSCISFPIDKNYPGPKPLPDEIKKEYSYPKNPITYSSTLLEKKERYSIKRIEFQSSHDVIDLKHTIKIDYYDVHDENKTSVIFVLPILGGNNEVAKFFASYFADQGYNAVIVHRQDKYKELDNLDTGLRQIVFDHHQAIDWIHTQPGLNKENIGVFGVSMGGIKASLLLALDSRIKAGVVALAGGDLPYILMRSTEKGIVKRRKQTLIEKKMTFDQLSKKLKEEISCDPINYAEFIDARKLLMILAIFDSTVPFSKGQELREKIGKPKTIYLFADHYTALIYIFYVRNQALKFFDHKFTKSP